MPRACGDRDPRRRAQAALSRARKALDAAPNELLARALVALEAELSKPIARLEQRGAQREADLFAIEAASSGEVFLVDACRRLAIAGRASIPLAKRSVLFALLLALARAWPADVARDALAAAAFDTRRVNVSHRSRLRVEIGRLRKLLEGLGEPVATTEGYVLETPRAVAVLLPPDGGEAALVEARIVIKAGAAKDVRFSRPRAPIASRMLLLGLVPKP